MNGRKVGRKENRLEGAFDCHSSIRVSAKAMESIQVNYLSLQNIAQNPCPASGWKLPRKSTAEDQNCGQWGIHRS